MYTERKKLDLTFAREQLITSARQYGTHRQPLPPEEIQG